MLEQLQSIDQIKENLNLNIITYKQVICNWMNLNIRYKTIKTSTKKKIGENLWSRAKQTVLKLDIKCTICSSGEL